MVKWLEMFDYGTKAGRSYHSASLSLSIEQLKGILFEGKDMAEKGGDWLYLSLATQVKLGFKPHLPIQSQATGDLYPFLNEYFKLLYPGKLFHCCMLDKSICHFRGVRSILSLLFYF